MGRQKSEETYKNILDYYNRKKETITCECGKIMVESKLENHLKSKLHQRLLELKTREINKINVQGK